MEQSDEMSITEKLQAYTEAMRDFRDNKERYLVEALESRTEGILAVQKKQMLEGKSSDGDDIRPLYSEDLKSRGGFFVSPKRAESYRAWKQKITPNANRDADSPNLYIPFGSHHFHDELEVEIQDTVITVRGATPYADEIIAKYGLETFGLTEENWRKVIHEYEKEGKTAIDELRERILLTLSK